MFGIKTKTEIAAELEAKEARSQTRKTNVRLRAEVKELELALEKQNDAHAKTLREHNRSQEKKNEQIATLTEKVQVLNELNNNRVDQQVTTLQLDERETLLDAREAQYDTFKKELKNAQTEAKEHGEERYKTGYSDGLADGLRKVHDITQEDRKMSMQVALVAAASHTPGAATKAVESAVKSLGAGK